MRSLGSKTLIPLGLIVMALRSVLQQFVDRGGHATNQSGFLLGALFGIGLGLTLLGLWRNRRAGRCMVNR